MICMAQTNSNGEMPNSGNTNSEKQALEIKRNAFYNLEEIKVRWKKAALENCPGVPCIVTPPAPSFTCGTSTMTDKDNNIYSTVSIGSQCWTTTNLKVTQYDDGSLIPDLTSSTSSPWATSGARTDYTGATGIPSGQTYVSTYGYLYNWYAVNDLRKLCPAGWHVPTDGEWTSLIQFTVPTETVSATVIGTQSPNAGGKMKSTSTLWNTATPPSPGTDNFGFTVLPGGGRRNDGSFYNIRNTATFWSATVSTSYAWYRYLDYNGSNVYRNIQYQSFGASVRCLRD
jgi:uncharacterized protein (TIGR02145 family)